jgi:hypothetical protein
MYVKESDCLKFNGSVQKLGTLHSQAQDITLSLLSVLSMHSS